MFRGINSINLDVKGRVKMPVKHRDFLRTECDAQLVITVDQDQCLLIYPLTTWKPIEAEVMRLPNMDRQARRLQRTFVGMASDCTMDKSGRILIAAELREFAGLEKHVVLIGQGNKFELWDEEAWHQQKDQWLDELPDEAAAGLGALSL